MGRKQNKRLVHPYFGHMSKHHLVPKHRIYTFYGEKVTIPCNTIQLWRLRRDAWHILFQNKTLNEIIKYLQRKTSDIYGYQTLTWKILFKQRNKKEVYELLLRVRRIIRKKYAFLELDPSLQNKIQKIITYKNENEARNYLLQKYKTV